MMTTKTTIGLACLATAAALNQLAVRLNGGEMPTPASFTPKTRVRWLCDIGHITIRGVDYNFSAGDLFFAAGVALMPWWFIAITGISFTALVKKKLAELRH